MTKRIIVGGAGGTPALNFIRSLRIAGENFFLVGISCNKYDLIKAKKFVDKCFLVPPAKDRKYMPVLKQIITETNTHFMHAQNDDEVAVISRNRDELGVNTFLPDKSVVEICQDKFKSTQLWVKAGLTVPQTFLVNDEADLRDAFARIRGKVWLRAVTGAAGKWALPTQSLDFARQWINYFDGWGKVSAAECLTQQSVTWLSIWKNGKLVAAQSRKRLYWEFANRSISGVTGITGTGVTIRDKLLDCIAIKAIKAIDRRPHGIYGVDLTYDKSGIPNPTEINIGRFFTTIHFFSEAGFNMPHIYVKLAFDEKIPRLRRRTNPLHPGYAWVRGMDIDPVLTSLKEIDALEKELKNRIKGAM